MPQLFIFGDSITWGAWDPDGGGWAQRLRKDIDNYQVANRDFWCPTYNLGISGDTSSGIAERITREIKVRRDATEELIILIAIGINDSIVDLRNGSNTLNVGVYTKNLRNILNQAHVVSKKVGFIGLTPVNQDLVDPLPWDSNKAYHLDRVELFNKNCQQFCSAGSVPFLPIWDSWIEHDYRSILTDGLHPNAKGHELLYFSVRKFLIETKFLVEPFKLTNDHTMKFPETY